MSDFEKGTTPGFGRHYTPTELAKEWHVNANTIRRLFRDEPGVLKFGPAPRRGKRTLVSMRIPQHVADRVYRRHLEKAS